jgi:hypothetical protein
MSSYRAVIPPVSGFESKFSKIALCTVFSPPCLPWISSLKAVRLERYMSDLERIQPISNFFQSFG